MNQMAELPAEKKRSRLHSVATDVHIFAKHMNL